MKVFEPEVPSKERALLSRLVGQRLLRLVRYSWLPPEEAVTEYGVSAQNVFGRTAGPLALVFESGTVVGAGSQPSKNSVEVWLERDERGAARDDAMAEDPELYAVSADDSRYADARWAAACGTRVAAIRVFQQFGQNLTRLDLPNETAVKFELENGDNFFLGHGLHDDSDDFAVIHEQEILPETKTSLRELFAL